MEFHLLIVDDETTIRKGLSHFIDWSSIGCVVDDTACDGADAIEKLKKYKIDIIITDIRMPEADGLDLARYVYENLPEIKVILLTGYADFKYAQQAIRYGVTDFLLKPTSKEQLIHAVQNGQSQILAARKTTSDAEADQAFLRDQLLKQLTDSACRPEWKERLAACGLCLDTYYLAAFQLLPVTEELGALKDIFTGQKFNSYCYRYDNLLVSICHVKQPSKEVPQEVLENCREIIQIVSSLYALDIAVGISACHQGYSQFSTAAAEAVHALSATFYSEDRIASYQPEAHSAAEAMTVEDTLALCNLEAYLLDWDFETARSSIGTLFCSMKSRLAKSEDVKNLCAQIYYICSRILVKRNLEPLSMEILNQIRSSPAVFQLEAVVLDFIRAVEASLKNAGRPLSRTVEMAVRHIHSHLDGPLSLDIVASETHVNSSHLSRTFKKECGESITEYINKARVQKAKELLALPDTLAYEVAEKVGFRDPAYFSAIFKRYTGVTPTEFKAKAHRGEYSSSQGYLSDFD